MSLSVSVGTSASACCGYRSSPETASTRSSPSSICVGELGQAREADVDLLAEQGAGQRSAAVVGDVVDVVGVDADASARAASGRGGRARPARSRRRRRTTPGSSLPGLDEVVDRLVRRVAGHQDALRLAHQLGERGRVGEPEVVAERVDRPDHAEPDRHHRVLVAGVADHVGDRVGAAGALDVVDGEVAAGDVVVLHHLHRRAAGLVVAAAGALGMIISMSRVSSPRVTPHAGQRRDEQRRQATDERRPSPRMSHAQQPTPLRAPPGRRRSRPG